MTNTDGSETRSWSVNRRHSFLESDKVGGAEGGDNRLRSKAEGDDVDDEVKGTADAL